MTDRTRPPVRGAGRDEGSAPIEFIFAAVVLLVPLVYLVVAFAQVQAGVFAAQSTAIDAARTAARYPTAAPGQTDRIGALHFADHGVENAEWSVDLACSADCSRAGARVHVTVVARIPIPGVPAILGEGSAPGVTVSARHTDVIAPLEEP